MSVTPTQAKAVCEDLKRHRALLVEQISHIDATLRLIPQLYGPFPEPAPAASPPRTHPPARVDDEAPPLNGDRPPIVRTTQRDIVITAAQRHGGTFTTADLEQKAGLSRAKISGVITTLVTDGYVEVVDRRSPSQGGNRYRLIDPDHVAYYGEAIP